MLRRFFMMPCQDHALSCVMHELVTQGIDLIV